MFIINIRFLDRMENTKTFAELSDTEQHDLIKNIYAALESSGLKDAEIKVLE